MGRFSHLFGETVTPVTQPTPAVLPKRSNHFNAVAPITPVTPQNSHFRTNSRNPSNVREIKLPTQTEEFSRELYTHGVTGVTGVTALKNNDNPGNTSIFEGVTGVTGKADAKTAGRAPSRLIIAAVKSGYPAKISAAVAADPDLIERAAIREYDGNMPRIDAELAILLDVLDEAGYVL
jgi:hypothetical protein